MESKVMFDQTWMFFTYQTLERKRKDGEEIWKEKGKNSKKRYLDNLKNYAVYKISRKILIIKVVKISIAWFNF